jgi:hypothetical protein
MHLVDFLWTLFVIYFMVIYFIMLFRVIGDVFRDSSMSGITKALWLVFILVFPLVALLVYVIARGPSMAERDAQRVKEYEQAQQEYIRGLAGGGETATEQIAKGHALLTSGAISQAEFDALKAKALA